MMQKETANDWGVCASCGAELTSERPNDEFCHDCWLEVRPVVRKHVVRFSAAILVWIGAVTVLIYLVFALQLDR